jgi:hypothetical protein
MKMKTTQSQIEAKIQEIRRASNYPNAFFSDKKDLNDIEWMTRELKYSQFVYKIIAIPTASFCAFLIIYTIGMVLGIYENRNMEPMNLGLLVIGLSSLIMHSYQYKFKIEKLKAGLFLLEIKEGLKESS